MSDADEKLRALAEARMAPGADRHGNVIDAWIAAATPAVVLSLLDRLAAVEAKNAHLRAEVRAYQTVKAGWRGEKEVAIEAEIRVRAERDLALQALQRVRAARDDILADVNTHAEIYPKDQRFRDGAMHAWGKFLDIPLALAGPVGVPAEQPASVLPGLVERIQWAAKQIGAALADSRVEGAAAAWLRTINAGLVNASGDVPQYPVCEHGETTAHRDPNYVLPRTCPGPVAEPLVADAEPCSTCHQPMDSPPCSLSHGYSFHTVAGLGGRLAADLQED